MEKLINYIDMLYKWSVRTPNEAMTFFNQAFGAVQFYIFEHNLSGEEFNYLEDEWNAVFRPAFEALIYGGDAV